MISIWEKDSFFSEQDIVIAGGGFTGLWSAFYLKRKHPKLKITIIDRGLIPTGASTRNAGFACFGSLSEVVYDGQAMGSDKMLQLVEMRFRGLKKILKHFRKGIDFELCGGYELYDLSGISKEQLEHNINYINSLFKPITGSAKTYRLADEEIKNFRFGNTSHLVKNKYEGFLHSGKLVQALMHTIQGMGVQLFNFSELVSFHQNNGSIELSIRSGDQQQWTLKTSQLLICTNAFANELIPEVNIIPARGQVLLTSPIESLPWKGTFHSDEGFYYFRNLGSRVLLGGARNKAFSEEQTTSMQTSGFIQNALQQYLDEVVLPHYKGQYKIEMRWAGIMAMGSEKLPIVKQVSDGVFCAVRMSGMGVALAPVVAQDVMHMMR